MGASREQAEFQKLIKELGAKLRTGRKHLVYVLPGGANITLSRNPSDKDRAWKNALSTLKRIVRLERSKLIAWLLEHLPGGPEAYPDELQAITISLEAQSLPFLVELKRRREKYSARKG